MDGVPFFSLRRRARFIRPSLSEVLNVIAEVFTDCFKEADDREMLLAIARREANDTLQSPEDLLSAFLLYIKAKPVGYLSTQLEIQDGELSLLLSVEYIDLQIKHGDGAWVVEVANHISYNAAFEAHVEVNTRNFPILQQHSYRSPSEIGAARGIPFREEFRDTL